MDKIIDGTGSNIVVVIGIICSAIYQNFAPRTEPAKAEKYEELNLLHELLGKGGITREEFDAKKAGLLD